MYDPTVGEFINEDPIGFDAGDANLMRYVGNAPTMATDPEGLFKRGDWKMVDLGNYEASVTLEKADLRLADPLMRLAELITGDPKDKDAFPKELRQQRVLDMKKPIDVSPLLVRFQEKLGKNIVNAAKKINGQFPQAGTNRVDEKGEAYWENGMGPNNEGVGRKDVLKFWEPEEDWKNRPLCDCLGAQVLSYTKGLIDTVGAKTYDRLAVNSDKKMACMLYNSFWFHHKYMSPKTHPPEKLPPGVWFHFNNLADYGKDGNYKRENVISEGNNCFWGFQGNGPSRVMYSEKSADEWKAFLIRKYNEKKKANVAVENVKNADFLDRTFVGPVEFFNVAEIAMQLFDMRQADAKWPRAND